MNNNHWREIERIFDEALARNEADRHQFLEIACAGNEAMRREVEALLAADQQAQRPTNGFLKSPLNSKNGATGQTRLGAYQLKYEIARGGMGAVWLAERADQQFKQQVAIKLIHAGANNEEILRRFQHERQILADLNHPNIARLLDGGTAEDGRPYFVMEYIAGLPIDEYCRQHQLSVNERLKLFRQVCSAVQYAHQNLIIHRDLKPGNILVTNDGTPKLLDFGVAKLLQPDLSQSHHTNNGFTPMTPAYASPEQVRGDKLTTASDVYALGVVLYELLTGTSPYHLQENTFGELSKAICEQEPVRPSLKRMKDEGGGMNHRSVLSSLIPHPSSLSSPFHGDVDSIVLKALRKEPQARYSSVEQFSTDIQRYLDGLPTHARKGTFGYRTTKYVRRHKIPVAAAVLIALSLLGGIGATMRQTLIAKAAQHFAEGEQGIAKAQRLRAENALATAEDRRQQAEVARNEADQQRAEAELQKAFADEQRLRAEQGDETKRQFLYSAQMKLAQQAWESSNVERMQELLDAQLPQPGQQDLRGFEWYYLWRLAHSEIVTLKHAEQVVGIVLTPDGTKMASQTLRGDIRIWNIATGKELAPIHNDEMNGSCLAISPDGKFFAQGNISGKVKIFAVSTGALLSTLECSQQEIVAVTFSPDGRSLAACTFDGMTGVWAVPMWKQQVIFKASTRVINAVVFTPDSRQLVTAGVEGAVKVWNPLSGQELRVMPNRRGVYKMTFIPHSNNLVSAYTNGTIGIWDFATGQQLGEAKAAIQTGTLVCSPDGTMIATASYDQHIRLLNARNLTQLAEIKCHSGPIRSLAFTSDGKGLFTGSQDRTLKLINLQEVSESKLIALGTTRFDNVAFTRDGRRLISGDDAQVVRMHDLATGRELQKLDGHQRSQLADSDPLTMVKVAVSPDGRYFATSGYDGTVRTWDEKTGQPLQLFNGHARALYALAISPDGRFIASGGNELMVKVWDAASGRELHTMRGHTKIISAAAFSPQGKYLATSSDDGTIKLWDYLNGVELCSMRPYTTGIRNLAFSPDGKFLALCGDDRYIVLLDTTTWRTVRTLKGHAQFVTAIKFSPDGRRLVSSSADTTTRIWELEQGQEVLTLRGHLGINMDMAFSPDGTSLVTAGGDRRLLLWPAATPREVMARSSAGDQALRANVSADAVHNLLAVQPNVAPVTAPFEIADQKINGWIKSNPLYAAMPDALVSLSNKTSALLMSKKADIQGFGAINQSIRADQFRGQRVRFSGYLKSLEAGKSTALWFRVDGTESYSLEFGNTTKASSTDWMKYDVVLNVPEDALILRFGFILNGSGQLWGDDFRLEIVDADVPVTGLSGYRERNQQAFIIKPEAERAQLIQQIQEYAKRIPLKPINLDFEQ